MEHATSGGHPGYDSALYWNERDLPVEQIHKWKRCKQCRHPEHSSACIVCRCLAVTSQEEIEAKCKGAGGCLEHPTERQEHRCNACGHTEGEGCGCSAHAFVSREHCDRCEGTWLIKNAKPEDRDSLPPCRACKHTLFYFDRSPCASCGVEHYRCRACRVEQIACVQKAPEEEPKCPPACAEAHTYSGSCVFRADGPCDCSSAGAERHADYCRTQRDSCPHCGSEDHKWADCKLYEQAVRADAPLLLERCSCGHLRQDHHSLSEDLVRCIGNRNWCPCGNFEPEDPPLTPEEEEEADCACGEPDTAGTVHRMDGPCYIEEPPPPQPVRRPPHVYAYSVQGHLYEVALSGDATVVAQDGALIITHSLGPVAGIVQARPLEGEQS